MARRLGQHFLTDPRILDRIVALIEPDAADLVVEIGPGRGSLTRRLAHRVRTVVAVERDKELAERLSEQRIENVRVVYGDALKEDWQALAGPESARFKVIGNVPYYISTPLIHQALSYALVSCIVFLIQREVADRICAAPGNKDYGGLSVGVQAFSRPERAFRVAAGAFSPPPTVESTAVRLVRRADPLVPFDRREDFRRFVTATFSQRRKRIVRVLRNTTTLDASAALGVIGELGIDPDTRPEMLAPESLADLFVTIFR
jgi:16S rRNA (adenine1518-N6/adenine1519-N6)-dimethyltransferase